MTHNAESEVPELPITRELRCKGDPWGYGWVRVTHTVLHAGQMRAEPRAIPPVKGDDNE